ncbi:MAG TPA: serine/threonine-protein kinase [Burkholderiales bacterium]|nr:serine/threonine-protein kinase [Burkholderiales bacterium]
MSTQLPEKIGRYRILGELGRGAMGVVYRAEDPLLSRPVAIKTIIMSVDPDVRAEYERRFYQEAKAAGGLNHPNLITVHDIGREGDLVFMAMELLEGVELRQLMQQGRIELRTALEILAQVADGLAYAHERGVVHRDIKPGNVMVLAGNRAKVMDFGIARMRASDIHTQTGAVVGSPKYMSPEQVSGTRVDGRSDIFSLGIVLYELAAGAAPFSAPDTAQFMHQIATATPPPPSALNERLPRVIDLIVARALEKDPEKRYQSAAEMAADMRSCLATLPAAGIDTTVDFKLELTATRTGRSSTAAPKKVDTRTLKLGAVAAGTEPGLHLPLARRFDSKAALDKLARLAFAVQP